MSLSYLETSLDRINAAARDDVIEICINPDGTCWGEFQGDHFMRALDQRLTGIQVRDLGNQIASSANTTMSKDRPIVSVSITYKGRPIRAQVITPPAVLSAMSIYTEKSASSKTCASKKSAPCAQWWPRV
jgi:type IV secretion system protein VirB11